jgi:hypothetical protein
MTPKEKAEELVCEFYDLPIMHATAKECALIAVDEIIKAMDNVMLPNPFKQYWNKVKQEIEKL